MPKDLDEWRFHGGRVYDMNTLKEPHVIPLIESLYYDRENPIAIDVGSGSWSLVDHSRLPWPRHFSSINVDIAVDRTSLRDRLYLGVDIEDLVNGQAIEAEDELESFVAGLTRPPYLPGVDLIVYSEILNYIDYKESMKWFDDRLKPGGFTIIGNLATRGYRQLFSEDGVKSNQELLEFVTNELGHDMVTVEYPWGARDDYEGFLLLASQKPVAATDRTPAAV